MSSKGKGTRAERELIHMFHDTKTWIALRAAGSGSTPLPCPDLLAGNNIRKLAIECKSIKARKKYFDKVEIKELIEFSTIFGAEPWLAVRYDNEGWYFVTPEDLEETKKGNPSLSLHVAMKKGLRFPELIGIFKQQKLD